MNQATHADATTPQPLALDAAALRQKYAQEREVRLKPTRNEQYIGTDAGFDNLVDDPYIDQPIVRDAVDETIEVLVVGGGFGGLVCAANLTKAGIGDFRILDKAGDFGGTWYWNRYPGAQCDIESYIYMPLLEETGYVPTEKYAHAPEIFAHAQRIARHFGLYEKSLLQTQVLEMTWDEQARRWIVSTDRGDVLRARYVFTASGPLNRPKLPGIAGIDRFKGALFHTSRWDYAYTGGNASGGMTGLADKRVAVIGTGATAVQCVPYLAQHAKYLYVIQRTPANVGERGNAPTDPAWAQSLQAGWQRERMRNFNGWIEGVKSDSDLVNDGWTQLFYGVRAGWIPTDGSPLTPEIAMPLAEQADFRIGSQWRERVAQTVQRADVAEGLMAWYGALCKRPAFNDNYLPAFNRDNVSLIDTQGSGLDEIGEYGFTHAGTHYPVNCIVFATGFEVGTDYSRRAGFTVRGVGEKTLAQHFENGMRTLHGFYAHGFPNLFFLGVGQNGVKPNFTDMLTEQVEHLVDLIATTRRSGGTRIEAEASAEAAWLQTLVDKSQMARAYLTSCTPSYFNDEGGDLNKSWIANNYGGGTLEFAQLLQDWRERDDHQGLSVD
ncbi:monooxygenase [Variovorax sp. WS11]|uniref:flavin-containing monooxygenase n=1 Tax=Variovorax sp. WS11 TaxID=1105204 RepID=UPI000D0DF566|nr:NAD(P)/FAD-dependent oxidoreductase [Variovorax sp. WS11]NDZ17724.1 NAD(P)/FAD-dependent oxidoreductase [Variovorax sp. WS11]PSL80470.1 monooxygenase [Variovorax sp. WS11]